jgi:hypothetical protein
MRILLVTILIFLSAYQSPGPDLSSWLIEHNSSLRINGSSNINSFTCDVKEYLREDTLWCMQNDKNGKYVFTSNSMLRLDIRKFDCHHKYITADFRKMVKADVYPTLMIRFLSLDPIRHGSTVKGQVLVELAGKKKIMDVVSQCEQLASGQMHLTGTRSMRFPDFELEPPKKIGGLIRIREDIDVQFNLYFRKLHS